MEDATSNSVKLVGEQVPESDVSSIGLSPQVTLTADSLRKVTGPRTAETRSVGDADTPSTAREIGEGRVYNPVASGLYPLTEVVPNQAEIVMSRHLRPKSPQSRSVSPKSGTSELRARMARIRHAKTVRYLPAPIAPAKVIVPRDVISREEADAALTKLHQAISDANQRADQLVSAAADTQERIEAAGQVAAAGATGVAETNAGLEFMAKELREELQQMRAKITKAEERASTAQKIADSAEQRTDAALQMELNEANININEKGAVVQGVAGLETDFRMAQQSMAVQTTEMRNLGNVNDEMMEQVGELTDVFHQIDEGMKQGNVVNSNLVKSAPVHVQGTQRHVNEPAGNVQTVPIPNVINLVSQGTDESGRDEEGQENDGISWLDGNRLGSRHLAAASTSNAAADSSSAPMASASASISVGHQLLHVTKPQLVTSSQFAMQSGEMNRPPTIHNEPQSTRRVVVENPPQLPSGTQRAIERIVQAYMERMGVHAGPHEANVRGETVVTSTARNVYNLGPESTQFSFPRISGNVAPPQGQQIFATAQWRPKEPPTFTGKASDDVYLWTSLVRQYFVFMSGTARQEVAFAATLLRGAAHEWYMGYERRNDNQPPQDWPTMQQAILDRFGSNIREAEAHAKLLTISQGKRSVREYTSEFEMLLGRLSTRDETTWKNIYVWGLQPHLAEAVALKYPTTIAQAAGHAEEIELAEKASQRPNLGNLGARAIGNFSGRGGSQAGPRAFAQGRGRGNVGANQRGGRGNGGRRGGGWNHGRQGGTTTTQTKSCTQCFSCGKFGHYASQCPKTASTSGSSGTAQSVNQRRNFGQAHGGQGQGGNRRGGGNRRTRFSGLNVVYDAEGNEYPIDEDGKIVLEFVEEEEAAVSQQNLQKQEN